MVTVDRVTTPERYLGDVSDYLIAVYDNPDEPSLSFNIRGSRTREVEDTVFDVSFSILDTQITAFPDLEYSQFAVEFAAVIFYSPNTPTNITRYKGIQLPSFGMKVMAALNRSIRGGSYEPATNVRGESTPIEIEPVSGASAARVVSGYTIRWQTTLLMNSDFTFDDGHTSHQFRPPTIDDTWPNLQGFGYITMRDGQRIIVDGISLVEE